MRRSTPILATCLVLLAGAAAWFLLADRGPEPTPMGVESPDAPPAAPEEATLAARRPTVVSAPSALAGRIRVAVGDASGAPQEGVLVTVRRTGPVFDPNDPASWGGEADADARARRAIAALDATTPPPAPKPEASATTDAAGLCDVSVDRTGQYEVRAEPASPRWGSSTTVQITVDRPRTTAVLRMGEGSRLRGRVVDAQDRPLAAVLTGRWSTPEGTGDGWSSPSTPTDPATGAFAWDAVPPGKGWVYVTVPGRLKTTVAVTTPREDEVVIRLPEGGVVRGRVADTAGDPVSGADLLVEVGGAGGSDAQPRTTTTRARTDADGAYRMEGVAPGKVLSVAIAAEGFRASTVRAGGAPWEGTEVATGKETVLDLVLGRGSVVEGRVLVEGTGAPIEGATVQALVPGGRWGERPAPSTTDAQGRFRFEGLAVGRYVLVATSATHYLPAFASQAGEGVSYIEGELQLGDAVVAVIAKDGERQERDLRLRPGLSVRGRVVGPDGSPVEGVKVTTGHFQPWNAVWRWGVAQSPLSDGGAVSAADGTFRLTGLPPGNAVTLTAKKAPFTAAPTAPFRLVAGEPEPEVVVKLEVGGSLAGRVLDADGKPVGGVQIQWWARDAGRAGNGDGRSEPDGTFRLEGLPPSSMTLNAWAQGMNATLEITPALAPAEARAGVELRFRRKAKITGVTVDAQGAPVPGARLVAAPAEPGLAYGSAVSRDDGTFEMTSVGEGAYRVGVNPSGSDHVLMAPTDGQSVTAPADGVRIVTKPRARTLVAGRVLLPDGGLVPLCTVHAVTAGSQNNRIGGDNADEVVGGTFRRVVEAAPPFPLRVSSVCGADGRRLNVRGKTVTVERETTDLVIALEGGLVVAGRVTDPKGVGLAGVRVSAGVPATVTDASGAFRFEGLAEGDVTIVVAPPPGLSAPPLKTVKAGTVDVVLACAAGSAIAGRVLGPDGAPVTQGGVMANWPGGGGWGALQADGSFRVEGVPVDAVADLETNVWAQNGPSLRPAKRAGVRAGTEDVVLRLEAGATLTGVAVDADGRPLVGRYVQAHGDGTQAFSPPTDGQGRFTIGGLPPGPVRLTVVDEGTWRAVGVPLQVEAPATGVRLVVPRKATISGRLVGEGVAGFTVFARPAGADDPEAYTVTVEVGADGRFRLEVWEGSDYTVGATRRDDDRFARLSPVRVGADVTLALEPGLSIEGTLLGEDGKPPTGAWVLGRSATWQTMAAVGADGTWRLRGLPGGTYRVRSFQDAAAAGQEVEAGAVGVRLVAGPR